MIIIIIITIIIMMIIVSSSTVGLFPGAQICRCRGLLFTGLAACFVEVL